MGRLTMRALYDTTGIEIIQINDPAGNAETLAHLMNFDSVHGRWSYEVDFADDTMVINGHTISVTQNNMIEASDWSNCDLVIEASGVMKTKAKLQAYFDQGVKQVVVTAPVKEDGVLNVVYGVNHDLFDVEKHNIVTAASCTTNCLAPPIKVLQEKIGIVHGSMTTIHDITNTPVSYTHLTLPTNREV